MQKRIIGILLALLILVSVMPVNANAYKEGYDGMGPAVITGGQRDFQWPVPGNYNLQSCFYDHREHYALDVSAAKGTKVIASYDGTVIAVYTKCSHNSSKDYTCCNDGYGNYVVLKHTYKLAGGSTVELYSRYSHLTAVSVSKGDTVKKGAKIGTIGSTGYSQGFHLDFQILRGGWSDRRKYSIDPYANQLLELPDNLEVYDSWDCGKSYYKLVKELYATSPSVIAKTYPAYCTIKATADTAVMTLPCSGSTDASSKQIQVAKKGETLTAIELILNSQGNHWYKVQLSDGKTGYVPSSRMKFEHTLIDDLQVSGVKAPTSIKKGNVFSIEGKITTKYNNIHKVTAYVYEGVAPELPASAVKVTGGEATVNGKSYSLKGSAVDNKVEFNKLAVGSYEYAIYATTECYYAKDEKTATSVKSTHLLYTSNFNVTSSTTSCSHSYSSQVTTAATCAQSGVKTYTCSKCKHSYTESIAATGEHAYASKVTTEPTCGVEGVKTYTCKTCGKTYTESIPETGEHDYMETVISATCTQMGWWMMECRVCGKVVEGTTPATGEHVMVAVGVRNPTCEEQGVIDYKCEDCGYSYSEFIPALIVETYPSYCTIKTTLDSSVMTMPISGYTNADSKLVKAVKEGETFTAIELVLNSEEYYWYKVLLSDGKTGYLPASRTEFVEPLLSDLKITDAKAPTTLTEGNAFAIEGKIQSTYVTIKEVYAYVYEGKTAPEGPDSKSAKTGGFATVNGKSYSLKGSALDGKVAFDQLPVGTYIYAVYASYECYYAKDGQNITSTTVKERVYTATFTVTCNHSYSSTVTTEPTCGTKGVKTYTCKTCGKAYTEDIPATGEHVYTNKVTTEATCEKDGVLTYTCKNCTKSYNEPIKALGHAYQNGYCTCCNGKDPNYIAQNAPQIIVSSQTARAGETVSVTVALKNNPGVASLKLNVEYDDKLTLQSITYNSEIGGQSQPPQKLDSPVILNWIDFRGNAQGDWVFATLTFLVSEEAKVNDKLNIAIIYDQDDVYGYDEKFMEQAIPFAVQDGFIEVVSYLPGDINGDGKVNNRDASRLFQYLSGWNVEVATATLDVNGDGKVNNRDASRLFQYLSGWDVEIY